MKKRLLAGMASALTFLVFFSCVVPTQAFADTSDPHSVRIVTSDIQTFWHAYDLASKSRDPAKVYAYDYFAAGSPGLWGFVPNRLSSPAHLVRVIEKYRSYYLATRAYMNQIPSATPAILADLQKFKTIYPQATFPNIYFVVGALNSGGTSVPNVGLVLGAEMNARPPKFTGTVAGWPASDLNTVDRIPAIVTHELMHYNQHDAQTNALLDETIMEGSADFLSHLVDGHTNSLEWTFGCAHEIELWKAFTQQMSSADEKVIEPWLFSSDQGPLGAPPMIGYWIGARIAQTYYEAQSDKRAAVSAILHIENYDAFLKASGYPERRPACTPEASLY